jgi:ubiquinone/menaquinone biosynthesis C-methylase UbiE
LSLLIPPRSDLPELMDEPGHPPGEIRRALRDIQWVNRRLSGWRVLRRHLPSLLASIPAHETVRILDLGTGSADLPRAIARWARHHSRAVQVVGVDQSPEVIDFARRECSDEPAVRLVQADLHALPFPEGSFHLATCSLFLHHFDGDGAVEVLRVMARQARHALLVNDLERHRLAYWSIRVLGRLRGCSPLFRHDAPLSVLRAYRRGELRELVRSAGLEQIRVERHFPYRLAAFGPVNGERR